MITEEFLLKTRTSKKLFFDYAKDLPIYDYHCHLNPQEIAEDKKFKNITELWLGGDHYKWRYMRCMGISEEYITGSASDFDKFKAYAKSIMYAAGNPLYHWSHLELQRYFGITDTINENNAEKISRYETPVRGETDDTKRRKIKLRRTRMRLRGLRHVLS